MATSDWRKEKYPILFEPKDKENGWDGSRDEEFWEAVRAVKKECMKRLKTEGKYNFSEIHFPTFEYPHRYLKENEFQTATLFWEEGESYSFEASVNFRSAKFENADFSGIVFGNSDFIEAKFKYALFFNSEFKRKINFNNAEFEKCDFKFVTFQHVIFDHATMLNAIFWDVDFGPDVKKVYFCCTKIGTIEFWNTKFHDADFDFCCADEFVIRGAYFDGEASFKFSLLKKIIVTGSERRPKTSFKHLSFSNATFEKSYFSDIRIDDADRSTFRIIKKSFDDQGDHIQANKFYSREMAAYGKELAKTNRGRHIEEKIVFYLGKTISNFSQSWWRPFQLIVIWSYPGIIQQTHPAKSTVARSFLDSIV